MDRKKIVSIIYIAGSVFAILVTVAVIYYGEKQKAKMANLQDPIVVTLATAETGDILVIKKAGEKEPERILISRLQNGQVNGQAFAFDRSEMSERRGLILFNTSIPYGEPSERVHLFKKDDTLGYGGAMARMIQEAVDHSQGK